MHRTVLVTGASSGIGRAIAEVLAENGHTVFGTGRRFTTGQSDQGFRQIEMDVTDEGSIRRGLEHILERTKAPDVLINCAGNSISGPAEETPIEDARHLFDTNLFGVMKMCRAILPYMRENKEGTIINISSIGGEIGLPFRGYYCASKFALEGLSESLAMEVRPFGIRVCVVAPGNFRSNIHHNKVTVEASEDSPYKAPYQKILDKMNAEVDKGADPRRIGHYVNRLLGSEDPSPHHRVGAFLERSAPLIKRLLPQKLFQQALRKFYKV